MENNKFGLNINVLKNQSQIIKPKQDKRKQLMRKPLPFNMNFWKSNNDLPLPRNDQNREYLINKSNKSPLILNHPFNKKVIRFHNKNSSEILNPNKIKYYSYFRKNPFEDDSYDLLKASWDVSKKNKPTEKLRSVKLGNPFIPSNKHKTNFGFVYSAGGIPCRIEHGGVNLKLNWSIPIEKLDYDPILITCFEGLLETEHPYNFVGKQCIRELLAAEGAKEKVEPILSKLIGPLKDAIKCDNPEIFGEAMNDLQILSNMVKDKLNKYVHFFLQNLNKKSFNPKYKERVFEVLKTLEENGGPEVFKEIKRKIPTYTSL
jgi:hypothetical protein